ncbi:Protein T04B2.5 [Aphelenchoides avenae]|nr:Protein T04B2.5 [Aphelenchus avenae]
MPPRCAHRTSSNKKFERIRNLIEFCKTASNAQLSSKLAEVWATPQCSITDARILLTLGANPEGLYSAEYGEKTLKEREESGSVCPTCSQKYNEFLEFAPKIYDAQFREKPLLIENESDNASNGENVHSGERTPGLIALSLDGGGMRGLVSIVCLLFASRRIFGDESLPNRCDWFIGCSTGSMLALALAKGYSLKETFFLYWEMKDEIFLDKPTMKRLFGNVVDKQTGRVNAVLQRVFPSENDTFRNCAKRLTVPTLNIATVPGKLVTFRNYTVKNDSSFTDVHFRDAARASSAAPTQFNPHVMDQAKFVDGSLVANCPLIILFREYDKCRQLGENLELDGVISIGTGEPNETVRRYESGKSLSHRSRHIRDMATLLIEQVVGHEKSAVECAADRCIASGIPFCRISPVGINARIDQIEDGKLMDMIWHTLLYLLENVDRVDELGRILKKRSQPQRSSPRRRCQTIS